MNFEAPPMTSRVTSLPMQTRNGNRLYFMPIWTDEELMNQMRYNGNWGAIKVYCDLQTRDTVAMWDGKDAVSGSWLADQEGFTTDMDFAAYVWHEDGTVDEVSTTDMLWWCLDDILWGFGMNCIFNQLEEDGYTWKF